MNKGMSQAQAHPMMRSQALIKPGHWDTYIPIPMTESRMPPFVTTSSVRCTVSLTRNIFKALETTDSNGSNRIKSDYDYTMDDRISFIIYGIPTGQAYQSILITFVLGVSAYYFTPFSFLRQNFALQTCNA